MPTITIREQSRTEDGFQATLSFDGRVEYPITVCDPFSPREERELEWYFEDWIAFPFTDTTIAERAALSVKTYGESLFAQVFRSHLDAYSDYRELRGNLSQVQIEILGQSPEFQALHWEAIKDPDLPRPLAVDSVMVRKHVRPVPSRAKVQPSPVIHLLVVTARPDEEQDVGYRTISRPLIEAIANAGLRVKVELLRPGTYEALTQQLDAKEGVYHIVHFDTHGGLLTYEQFQQYHKQPEPQRNYVYQRGYGLPDMPAYDGVKAFLFFEGEEKGKPVPVEASELADLLTGKGIPVCILNACQSGKQIRPPVGAQGLAPDAADENSTPEFVGAHDDSPNAATPETSLGSRLMTAGMQMVVAMGYSVTVSAAAILMETLYRELFAEKGITEAIRRGRQELYNRKARRAYFNQIVDLEDWLLPVVYCNQTVDLKLRQFTPEEENEYYEAMGSRYQFPEPTYGFVGRDLEILKIEKALLRHNVLLLQGMGGTGKTTLLNYLRQWWQTTQFARDVFYFGYDERAWTLEQILHGMGKAIYGGGVGATPSYELLKFQAMNLRAQEMKLVATLRANPYVLILDNLESVTGEPLAIQNTLPPEERAKIREFLGRLAGGEGKTRVVLGSRSGEEWLRQATFRQNVYPLRGLDPESRSVLAERILERQVGSGQRIEQIRTDEDFLRLMKLLAGYPLAMEVVLANLARQSPREILQALAAADVRLDSGSGDKTQSILRCVEYSHSNLSPEAQRLLVCLAPFSGFVLWNGLPKYAEELRKLEPFRDYPFEQLDQAVQEAINWGLLSPVNEQMPQLLTIQPILPYFLQARLNELDETTREALREGFKNHYRGLAGLYQQLMESKNPQRQMWLDCVRLEYENLYSALQICLEKQANLNILFCLTDYFENINDYKREAELTDNVCRTLENYPKVFFDGEFGYQLGFAFHRLANSYLGSKQYELARRFYEKALEVYPRLSFYEEKQKQLWCASEHQQLGIVHQELWNFNEARNNYQQALEIFIELDAYHDQAVAYQNIGRMAQELREYEEARHNYHQALKLFIEFGDYYHQAGIYHQLGMVDQDLREYETARRKYQKALEIFDEFGDRCRKGITYHQLGTVCQELQEHEEARFCYQQALEIFIEFGDRYGQASIYHQLGIVAQGLWEYKEARCNYQKALELFIDFGDRHSQAGTYHQLGMVAQALREYGIARRNYYQAFEIFVDVGDRYSQAVVQYNLGVTAQELGEYRIAQRNYQKALELSIKLDDHYNQARTYHQLGTVAQELRECEEARHNYQKALELSIEFRNLQYQAITYYCLGNLAEEQENYAEAQVNLQQALERYLELKDEYWASRAQKTLDRIAEKSRS